VVVQVQRGCRTHCSGTSQTQRAVQVSETTQSATAVSGGSGAGISSAEARNESSTIQFVWQTQIGCVAFCWHTSQSQEASQNASTLQEADAESALMAWAENLAETVQYVFQAQQGCEHECYGVSQYQSSAQTQTTSQWASADGEEDVNGGFLVPDWLIAFALNIGATIQTVYQYQEALCMERCVGDAQLQEAIQHALTDQRAVASAAPPEPPSAEGPPGGQPPPGEEPPGGQPPPGPPGPGALPEAGMLALPNSATPSSLAGSVPVVGEHRTRTMRRQELELRTDAQVTGGFTATLAAANTPALGAGPAPVSVSAGGRPAGAGPEARVTRQTTSADTGEARGAGGQLPPRSFVVPSTPNPDGAMSWLALLFLTAALAAASTTSSLRYRSRHLG
jgi:hypothetical protein